jgi:hypothetical protein
MNAHPSGISAPHLHPHRPRAGARDLLMVSLSRFFAEPENMRAVLPYISGDSDVSLRLIDWFVTNFSKKHNVVLSHELVDAGTGSKTSVHFNVYLNYRAQLKAYSKQQFDPFRRRDRIEFFYDEASPSVETTIGQLNFFRWMLQNRVIDYVEIHAGAIERDMIACQRVEQQQNPNPNQQNRIPPQRQASHLKQQPPVDEQSRADFERRRASIDDEDIRSETSVDGSGGKTGRRCELSQPCCAIRTMTRVPGAHTVAFE